MNEYQDLSIESLVEMHSLWTEEVSERKRLLIAIETEIRERMINDGSIEKVVNKYRLIRKYKNSWDFVVLRALLEIDEIPPDKLAEAYVPEHQITVDVPEKWNMTKTKALAKYGDHPRKIIEMARQEFEDWIVIEKIK